MDRRSRKNSKYFSNIVKRNADKKNISKLIKNGTEINKTNEILSETKDFYKNIYKLKNNVMNNEDFFKNITLKQLTEFQKNS